MLRIHTHEQGLIGPHWMEPHQLGDRCQGLARMYLKRWDDRGGVRDGMMEGVLGMG